MTKLLLAFILGLTGPGAEAESSSIGCPGHGLDSEQSELFPPELVDFVPHQQNPVFRGRGRGFWDVQIRERGWILREGNLYHLWFTGYDGTRPGLKKLGYAASCDGIHWNPYPDNPIYQQDWVEDMMVVKSGDTYYMFAEGLNDRARLLTSTDRIHWKARWTLEIRTSDGRPLPPGPYGTPTAWHQRNGWYLFYERRDKGVWLAASKDLRVWTNVQDQPVLVPGPDAYDQDMIALNQIIQYQGRYYAYYHGSGPGSTPRQWSTNVAVSTDLRQWKKYPGNPILRDNKSSGILVRDRKQFRLYSMHDKVEVHLPRVRLTGRN